MLNAVEGARRPPGTSRPIGHRAGSGVLCGILISSLACTNAFDREIEPTPRPNEPPIELGGGTQEDGVLGELSLPSRFIVPADGSLPKMKKLRTEHVGQLTGTSVNPMRAEGMDGTDLGVTLERDGKLVFLFGDSWTTPETFFFDRDNQDSVAWTTASALPPKGPMPKLTWVTDGAGKFVAPRLPGVDLGEMNVPMEGVAVGPKTYVFFTTGWVKAQGSYTHSVLAEMNGIDVGSLRVVHIVPTQKFINVSVVQEGSTLYLYGSGFNYRRSDVFLAKVDVADLGNRDAWRYLSGSQNGTPTFVAGEQNAVPVSRLGCVGELSVRKWDSLGLYFMAYNCGDPRPRGVTLQWSRTPTGPWSDPLVVFDPARDADQGYEHFLHASEDATRFDDGLSELGREKDWGGEYGPYLIPRFFEEEEGGVISLVYTLSSWNPYQVHLMRTKLAIETTPWVPKTLAGPSTTTLRNADFSQGTAGWDASGEGFVTFPAGADHYLTTFVPGRGDAALGRLWQDFTVGSETSAMSFTVHGGDANVFLMRGNEIIRSARGRRLGIEQQQPVVWTLSALRGEQLRLVIADDIAASWGFISVSGIKFH